MLLFLFDSFKKKLVFLEEIIRLNRCSGIIWPIVDNFVCKFYILMNWNNCIKTVVKIWKKCRTEYDYFFLENVEIIQQPTNWNEANNECVTKREGRLAHPDELHPSTCPNISINVWLRKHNHERLTPWIVKIGSLNYI